MNKEDKMELWNQFLRGEKSLEDIEEEVLNNGTNN